MPQTHVALGRDYDARAACEPTGICINQSTCVDLPWSIWATMEKLRMWSIERVVMYARPAAKLPFVEGKD